MRTEAARRPQPAMAVTWAPIGVPRAASTPTRVLSPAPRGRWASVLEASSQATIFHTPDWLDACCAAGGFEDASRLYELADGREIILPIVRPKGLAPVRPLRSMPDGWGFGGALASGSLRPEDVATMLGDLLGSTEVLIVKTGPWTTDAWSRAPARRRLSHIRHVIDVADGFDSLWSELSSSMRNKIRKAEKGGVRVRSGAGTELAHVHSGIHLSWAAERARRRGMPVSLAVARAKRDQPAHALAEIAERLGERCRIVVASIKDEPVASAVMLFHGECAQGWRAASLREADTTGYANYLMQARAIEEAAARGHRFVDVGESGGSRPLIEFKEQLGAEPRTYDVLTFGPRFVTSSLSAWDRLASAGGRLATESFARLSDLRRRRRQ